MTELNQIHVKGFQSIPADALSGNLRILERSGNVLRVHYNGENHTAIIKSEDYDRKEFVINISGYNFTVKIDEAIDLLINRLGFKSVRQHSLKEVKAPMPGLVVELHVREGDEVEEGDKLISLEAMKMENIIKATGAGKVAKVWVSKSSSVDKNQVMITFE